MELCLYIAIIIIEILIFTIFYMITNNNKRIESTTKVDNKITKMFFKQLDEMILIKTTFNIQSELGKKMSTSMNANIEIENSEVYDLYSNISKDIMDIIADSKMYKYLICIYGVKWIDEYVRFKALACVLSSTSG